MGNMKLRLKIMMSVFLFFFERGNLYSIYKLRIKKGQWISFSIITFPNNQRLPFFPDRSFSEVFMKEEHARGLSNFLVAEIMKWSSRARCGYSDHGTSIMCVLFSAIFGTFIT